MASRPSRRITRALVTVVGGTALAVGVGSASAATGTPQIVMVNPAANLSTIVRAEQRKGNEVDQTFRAAGKGFVADLDKADIARLNRNPDVLLIEPDRPVHSTESPGVPVPDFTGVTAPANDPFSRPAAISGATGSTTLSTAGATREAGEPDHGATSGAASVWFTWTAPASGSMAINTAGSGYDTLLAAYTGTAVNSLTQLAANDDANGGRTSAIAFTVTAGTTYRIAVDGWGGQAGAGVLNWTLTTQTPPANDAFAGPTGISGDSGTASGDTTLASREQGEPNHGDPSASASVWYRWTAPGDGMLTVSTQGSGFDTLLGVYSGNAVSGLTTLAQNDDADVGGVRWSQVQVPVTSGTTYAIAVDGWGGRRGGVALMWNLAAAQAPTPTPTPTPSQPSAPGSGAPQDRLAPSWGQDRIDQTALPLDGRIAAPLDGAGVNAYIIDTGVRGDHQEFGGRVQSGYDAVSGTDGTADCNGHGTHVAGTVAGATFGVAPAATIVPVRVLDCNGSGTTSGVIAGINWAAANHLTGVPAVANMSLGGGYSPALNAAVRGAVADGITFAVAAGNSDADACGASPASEPAAITVGASTSSDARASYSNFGSCVDIFAPGSGILSASNASTSGSRVLSGTSMASPHVAGAAALLLSGSPGASPQTVADALTAGATANVVSDVVGSPNRLLNVSSTVAPPPPVDTPTPTPVPTPVPSRGGGGTTPTPGNPASPVTPPVTRGPGRVHQRDVLAAPRLLSVTRTRGRLTVRITTTDGATGYQVFVNNRLAGRITGARGTVATSAPRGAKVRVRAVSPTNTSVLSNSVPS